MVVSLKMGSGVARSRIEGTHVGALVAVGGWLARISSHGPGIIHVLERALIFGSVSCWGRFYETVSAES
jgi:hypothetical protein